jgi:hypothetical protein
VLPCWRGAMRTDDEKVKAHSWRPPLLPSRVRSGGGERGGDRCAGGACHGRAVPRATCPMRIGKWVGVGVRCRLLQGSTRSCVLRAVAVAVGSLAYVTVQRGEWHVCVRGVL